jgi:hypothetical protein
MCTKDEFPERNKCENSDISQIKEYYLSLKEFLTIPLKTRYNKKEYNSFGCAIKHIPYRYLNETENS